MIETQCSGCGCPVDTETEVVIRPRASWGPTWFRTGHSADVFCRRSCVTDMAEHFGLEEPDWTQEEMSVRECR